MNSCSSNFLLNSELCQLFLRLNFRTNDVSVILKASHSRLEDASVWLEQERALPHFNHSISLDLRVCHVLLYFRFWK